MTLDVRARLAPALAERYRLERELGEGGMATVYLAQDLKHERQVAIKVLHPELAAVLGAERFLAEIRLTAKLQHPHILPLFDSGECAGLLYYVMPFVTGETLRARLGREQLLPVEDALRIVQEVASALDYAHRQGVVHRDVKPENILLQDGRALVADFGIALAVQQAGGSRMTQTGLSLGTPSYMAPEQAMGEREITPRADVYALGAVTYEMLAGEPPFTGPNAQAVLAKVLMDQPAPIAPKRKSVPGHVDAAIARALEKLPADRYGSAAEFAAALASPASTTNSTASPTRVLPSASRPARARWPLAAAGAVALVVLTWRGRAPQPAPPAETRQRVVLSVNGVPVPAQSILGVALAPDRRGIAFSADVDGRRRIWYQRRDRIDATPIAGTEDGGMPFFSPDGRSIGFHAGGRMRRVSIEGGAAVVLADSTNAIWPTAIWLENGRIVFNSAAWGLREVSSEGGESKSLVEAPEGGRYLTVWSALPGDRGVLFRMCDPACLSRMELWLYEFRTGRKVKLLDDVMAAWAGADDRIVYVNRNGGVFEARLNVAAARVTSPRPLFDGVRTDGLAWAFTRAASLDGMLYLAGHATPATAGSVVRPVWVDRATGAAVPVDSAWRARLGVGSGIVLSPDGRRAALVIVNPSGPGSSVFVKELDRGPLTRVTFDTTLTLMPRWTPDGTALTYTRVLGAVVDAAVWRQHADGSGTPQRLFGGQPGVLTASASPDGRWMVAQLGITLGVNQDIGVVEVGRDTVPRPLIATSFREAMPSLSPDGRWLTYVSDESGTTQVYVRPFPGVEDGKWQVSSAGGTDPVWSPRGDELFFRALADSSMMVAKLRRGPGFQVTGIQRLFHTDAWCCWGSYAVAPDARRFLMMRTDSSNVPSVGDLVLAEHYAAPVGARP